MSNHIIYKSAPASRTIPWPEIIAAVFSMIGLLLRFARYANREPWYDELFSIHNATGTLPPFWEKVSVGDLVSFPGHYLSLWPLGQFFGANKWALAAPHITTTILGFFLLYLICKQNFRTPLAYAVTFAVAAFNSQLIFHSFELRPYGVLSSLALAVFYCCGIIMDKGAALSRGKKFLLGGLFVMTAFYHAYGALILVVCGLYFLLTHLPEKTFKQIWLNTKFLVPYILICAAIFIWYGTGHPNLKSANIKDGIDIFKYIPNPAIHPVGFLKGIFGNLIGAGKLYFLLIGLLAALVWPHQERGKQWGFFLVLIVLPIELIFLADLSNNYWFIQRQFIWTAPLFAFLLGWCWDSLLNKKGLH